MATCDTSAGPSAGPNAKTASGRFESIVVNAINSDERWSMSTCPTTLLTTVTLAPSIALTLPDTRERTISIGCPVKTSTLSKTPPITWPPRCS
jgi:hypothetical protein